MKAKRSKRCIECQRVIRREQDRIYKSDPLNYNMIRHYREEYELKNKDKIKERTAEYRLKNKDVRNEKGKQKRMKALTPEEDLDINSQWDLAGYKNSTYPTSFTLTPKRKRNIMRLDHKFAEAEGSEYKEYKWLKPSEMSKEQLLKHEAFLKTLKDM
jgi:hypothetical protein